MDAEKTGLKERILMSYSVLKEYDECGYSMGTPKRVLNILPTKLNDDVAD
jgi:hypothetical protein